MLDPAEARLWAEKIGHLVAEAEATLIRSIRDSIIRDMGASRYDVDRLAKLATVRARLEKELGRDWKRILRETQQVLDDAIEAGQGQAIRDLSSAGLPTVLPDSVAAGVELIAIDTMRALTGMKAIALRDATDVYQHVVASSVSDVVLGASTRIRATQKALIRFARHGITGFIDKSGRQWRMDAYAEMAVRTGATHALNRGWMSTIVRNGEDLIRVSDHAHECPRCTPWENKVLSISGTYRPGAHKLEHAINDRLVTVRVEGSVDDAIAAGLWHPNCGHTATLFLPGVTSTPTPETSPETYQASQKQREHEREIRKLKRMVNASFTPEITRELQAGIREHQKAIRGILAEHKTLRRKRIREQTKTAH